MRKKGSLIAKIVLSVSIFASICFYLINIFVAHTSPFKYLWIIAIFDFVCAIIIIKLIMDDYKEKLENAENKYSKDIVGAFDGEDRIKRQLLLAIYYFSQNKNQKSNEILKKLESKCTKGSDYKAVLLFQALNYTNAGQEMQAIFTYEKAVKSGYATSNMYNNLGHLYAKSQDSIQAHNNYDLAIYIDATNFVAYHNKAQLCFKDGNSKMAIELLKKSLEINPAYRPSTTLLAVIYALEGDSKNALEFKGKAIENGENPSSIDRLIFYYKNQKQSWI